MNPDRWSCLHTGLMSRAPAMSAASLWGANRRKRGWCDSVMKHDIVSLWLTASEPLASFHSGLETPTNPTESISWLAKRGVGEWARAWSRSGGSRKVLGLAAG